VRHLITAPVLYPTAILQSSQAESQSKELRGHQPKRAAHPDLDSLARNPAAEMLHHLSKAKWSLSNLASMLRLNLFTYRDLRNWLDDPFQTPPLLPESQPLTLPLG
jgi:hypothetical protein